MTDNGYLKKIQAMSDAQLEEELEKTICSRAQAYQMLGERDLLIEASIKLHDNAIDAINLEKQNRIINSRKA